MRNAALKAADLAKRYQSLVRFGHSLQGVVRTKRLIPLIADEGRRVLGAARCSIFLVDEERRELWTTVAHGIEGRELRVPLGEGVVGRVATTGKSVRVGRAYSDPRFSAAVDKATGYRTRSILAVPLHDGHGKTMGVFEALNKRRGAAFDSDDAALLQLLSTLAAGAHESARLYEALRESYVETIQRLARAAEFRDTHDTAAHLRRISRYSRILAAAAGLGEARAEALEAVSPLHDVGKVSIPDAVLLKSGKLEPLEFELMKSHSEVGRAILKGAKSPLLKLAADIAWMHHERYDGSGYPRGLKGAQIPLEVEIVAVADVFDALTVERVYKRAWTFDDAAGYILDQSGRQFSPRAAAAFRRSLAAMRRALKEQPSDLAARGPNGAGGRVSGSLSK